MSKGRKFFLLAMLLVIFIGLILFVTGMQGFWNEMVSTAEADPALSGNYATNFEPYRHALGMSRFYPYLAVVLVCGAAIFIILQEPEVIKRVYRELRNR